MSREIVIIHSLVYTADKVNDLFAEIKKLSKEGCELAGGITWIQCGTPLVMTGCATMVKYASNTEPAAETPR
jgi:hypothetical protein